jgi:hypothetical protein
MRLLKTAALAAALAICVATPAVMVTTSEPAIAAQKKKKKSFKRSDFSKAEQKKIFDWALAQCRKQHGGRLYGVKVDYANARYICQIY